VVLPERGARGRRLADRGAHEHKTNTCGQERHSNAFHLNELLLVGQSGDLDDDAPPR